MTLYTARDEFSALLLAGSLAHGLAGALSDVDIVLVATEEEYARRQAAGTLTFSLWDICQYEGGYVDCKVVSPGTLEEIAERGSDPSRYAFQGAQILRSRIAGLEPLLTRVTRFPVEQKASRQTRFVSQILAWKWYLSQAEAKANSYLMYLSTQKLVLFLCRTLLNANERLYPYHKWLLAETARVPRKPGDFDGRLQRFLGEPTFAGAQHLADLVLGFVGLKEKEVNWPQQFLVDSELNWVDHEAPVDDL